MYSFKIKKQSTIDFWYSVPEDPKFNHTYIQTPMLSVVVDVVELKICTTHKGFSKPKETLAHKLTITNIGSLPFEKLILEADLNKLNYEKGSVRAYISGSKVNITEGTDTDKIYFEITDILAVEDDLFISYNVTTDDYEEGKHPDRKSVV